METVRVEAETNVWMSADAADPLMHIGECLQLLTAQLINQYHCKRHDAEDFAQEAFMKASQKMEKFDPAKGPFMGWLSAIAKRLLIDHVRAEKRHTPVLEGYARIQKTQLMPLEVIIQQENRKRLRDAIDQLPLCQKKAIFLHHGEGLTVLKTAEALGTPVGTVKSHLRDGRATVERIFRGD